MQQISVKLTPGDVERLDQLARRAGSRAGALRRLLRASDETAAPAGDGPLSRFELLQMLAEQARGGSAPAARALLDEQREDEARRQVERLNRAARGED